MAIYTCIFMQTSSLYKIEALMYIILNSEAFQLILKTCKYGLPTLFNSNLWRKVGDIGELNATDFSKLWERENNDSGRKMWSKQKFNNTNLSCLPTPTGLYPSYLPTPVSSISHGPWGVARRRMGKEGEGRWVRMRRLSGKDGVGGVERWNSLG